MKHDPHDPHDNDDDPRWIDVGPPREGERIPACERPDPPGGKPFGFGDLIFWASAAGAAYLLMRWLE